jgi:membrane-anchored glycerophosphoryl diester phosphodiesterase (GDPDase)
VEALLFTAVAVVLYLVSDRLLDALERRAGRRFEYRSMIFFAILLVLAVLTFAAVQHLVAGA